MPLFVTSEHIVLSWSERVGGPSNFIYSVDQEEMQQAAAEALHLISEQEALGQIVTAGSNTPNGSLVEAAACALILLGDGAAADAAFGKVVASEPETEWQAERVRRTAELRSIYRASGMEGARNEILLRTAMTRAALGIAG